MLMRLETSKRFPLSLPLAIALLLLGRPTSAGEPDDFQKAGDRLLEIVRTRFFDPLKAESWSSAHAGYASGAHDLREFTDLTRAALKELHASHTAFFTRDDPEYDGLRSIFRGNFELEKVEHESIGIDVDPRGFIRAVFAGGPAEGAGLRRGDRILKANGIPFGPVESFRGRAGRLLPLKIQRMENAELQEVEVTPRRIDVAKEWLDAQNLGSKVIERNGKAIAYMPLFSAAGPAVEDAVRNIIYAKFRDADALILDLRNGWGGASPSFLDIFDKAPPTLETIGRDGKHFIHDTYWRKPLFLLINGGSKSGKELVAFAVKKHKIGTLVGERTGGAVLAGSPFLIGDQGLLYLAVLDVLVDAERIEGKGVEPDIEVPDKLDFANGADPQLEKAIEAAAS